MPANMVQLRVDPVAASFALGSEGLQCHGVIQLGINLDSVGKPFSETVIITHMDWPPFVNLCIDAPVSPIWCPSLLIMPLPPAVPPPSVGPLIVPAPSLLKPGVPPCGSNPTPMMAAPIQETLPTGPPPLLWSAGHYPLQEPGGLAHFSAPGCVHKILVTGTVPPGTPEGSYSYKFYLKQGAPYTGPFTAPVPMIRIARIGIAVTIRRSLP